MYSQSTQIRVRYGETDQMGFVYYGNYALYYEVGRVEAIRSLGLTYKDLEDQGILMPVVRLESKYIQPAKYDDLLTITSTIDTLPDRFIIFDVVITNEFEQILNKAKVTLCFRDAHSGNQIRTPSSILQKLKPYFS
ncbi:MAG: acyl-CoA thioesterase [Saprospiraceae bacterium]|nr:acyl-CoA thioesterase [Saprospiraceae bacterium]